jgi:hypothetical protein
MVFRDHPNINQEGSEARNWWLQVRKQWCAKEGRDARVRVHGLASIGKRHGFQHARSPIVHLPLRIRTTTTTCGGDKSRTCGEHLYCWLPRWPSPHKRCTSLWMALSKSASTRNCQRTHWSSVRHSLTTERTSMEERNCTGNMIANQTRALPCRSLGRRDQNVHEQGRHWRIRYRRGDFRQQPPHRRPTRANTRPLYLQRRRLRPTPHLRHPPECSQRWRMAELGRTRHCQVHARCGDWRDKQD